jgi:hypothetical protein
MPSHVMIASPVRNRAWVLPEFLAALDRLEFPQDRLSFYFLANDCADASPQILRSWAAERPRAVVEEVNTGVPGWNRYRWPHYDYGNLAFLRNRILKRFLESACTHLFSVDSDVIVPPHALARLLAADRPVVAGVISNFPGLPVEDSPAHNFLFLVDGHYRHQRHVPEGLFEVDLTGAVVLIRRDVVEAGVRYEGHPSGEDAGFCEQAKARGFRLWCHGGVRCQHRMDDPQQPRPSRRPPPAGPAYREARSVPPGAGPEPERIAGIPVAPGHLWPPRPAPGAARVVQSGTWVPRRPPDPGARAGG